MKLTNLKDTASATGLSAHELRTGAIQGRYPFVWAGNKRLFSTEEIEEVIRHRMAETQTLAIRKKDLQS